MTNDGQIPWVLIAAVVAAVASIVSVLINIFFQSSSAERVGRIRVAEKRIDFANDALNTLASYIGSVSEIMFAGQKMDEVRLSSSAKRNELYFRLILMLQSEGAAYDDFLGKLNKLAHCVKDFVPGDFDRTNSLTNDVVNAFASIAAQEKAAAKTIIQRIQ